MAKTKGQTLNHQRQWGYHHAHRATMLIRTVWPALWYWLIDHGVLKIETDGWSSQVLLGLCKLKTLDLVNRWLDHSRESWSPQSIPTLNPVLGPMAIWMKQKGDLIRKELGAQPQIYTVNIFSSFLQKSLRAFTSVSLYWGKGNYHTFQELLGIVFELTLISRDWKCHCGPQLEEGLMNVEWCMGFRLGSIS